MVQTIEAMIATPTLISNTTVHEIPFLELPPPAIEIDNQELVVPSVSRVSSTSTSSNVLRVSGRGCYLLNYPQYARGPLRVMNFNGEDLESNLEEADVTIDAPNEVENDEEHDSDTSFQLLNGRSGSRLRFIDADVGDGSRFHSSVTPKPGDERRRFEEIMEARSGRSTLRKGLAKVRSALQQWCTEQSNSFKALCAEGKSTSEEAGACVADAIQGFATAEVDSSGGIAADGTQSEIVPPDEVSSHFNDTADIAPTQFGNESDLYMYRLVRVQARPH